MMWLAIASLFFYSYLDIVLLPIICISILGNYGFGLTIDRLPVDSQARRWVLTLAILLNLGALAFYKYVNFGIDIINRLQPGTLQTVAVVLPIGISFFTFTQIAYLVDVYRQHKSERSLVRYGLFVTYFPHLIAGPILHHAEMMPQFGPHHPRPPMAARLAAGLSIFAIGLAKKVIVADSFATVANPVFNAAAQGAITTFDAWTGSLGYALQLYFDFSGYCDMAVGISLLFGIALPFNFDSPYKSRSIIEFWRRWHITLSRFLRDYLYFTLGGNRRGPIIRNFNLFATMVIGGLWHGAGWTFIFWGALHGVFLLINHSWLALRKRLNISTSVTDSIGYGVVALLLTQFCVVIAWIFFRAGSFDQATRIITTMFTPTGTPEVAPAQLTNWLSLLFIAAFYLVAFVAPNVNSMFAERRVGLETYSNPRRWSLLELKWRPSPVCAMVTCLLLITSLLGILIVGDSTEFLYFQF